MFLTTVVLQIKNRIKIYNLKHNIKVSDQMKLMKKNLGKIQIMKRKTPTNLTKSLICFQDKKNKKYCPEFS
jgi:hypothetical protein